MKRATGVLLTGLLCAPHGVLAKQDPPVTLILRDNYVVSGTADDLPITLVVDGATPDRPVLNPEFVERAQIGTSLIGARFLIGPIVLKANTKVVKYSFDQREWKRRSLWADRAYADGYNGGVGPGGIPHDIVRFEMRPAQPGEQICALPLSGGEASTTEITVAGKTVEVSFTQKRDQTLASAAAGAVIADDYDGAFTGETRRFEITYGIDRPIRKLALSKPLALCGLSLSGLFVRTADFGDASGIAQGDMPADGAEEGADSNEIVVTAKRGKKDKNRYYLTLGRDDLSRCSSITYDKRAKEIRLSCVPG